MYTKTNSLKDIVKANKKDDLVIHFVCNNCDDEQVTDWFDKDYIDKERIYQNEIMDRIPCTNCGVNTLYLNIENITGFEV